MRKFLSYTQVAITDPVWLERMDLVRSVVLPYQWDILNDRVKGAEKSYCIRNFKAAAGEIQADHGGMIFQDSDLYKWLEAIAYSLHIFPDRHLEQLADEAIDLIIAAQEEDGYINTFYSLNPAKKRYSNLMEGHELYCAGHLIEAAVAYDQVTGKKRLLNAALKLARHLHDTFITAKMYPGHPEIELALIKLFEHTGEDFCYELAEHFINVRGSKPSHLETERQDPHHDWIWDELKQFDDSYFQAHLPVSQQRTAEGHAVRAMYLYASMADYVRLSGDSEIMYACESLIDNVRQKRMYVTGGIGTDRNGERFTTDYDLPNDHMYCETCASIGLMMFAKRMNILNGNNVYFDLWERALNNTVLAGMAKDGKHFFYVNPLQVIPEITEKNLVYQHVKPVRQKWFGVACCPPNIARTLMSMSENIYSRDSDTLFVNAHIASKFEDRQLQVQLDRDGDQYSLLVSGPPVKLHLRIPEGHLFDAQSGTTTDNEHVFTHLSGTSEFNYSLTPKIRIIRAHPKVASNAGKVCIMRGLHVYCLEQVDNGPVLASLYLKEKPEITEIFKDGFGELPILKAKGVRISQQEWAEGLYSDKLPVLEDVELTFVPYHSWGNREPGEMTVWVNQNLQIQT